MSTSDVANFIDSTNASYESLHRAFELQFWGTKMALSGKQYSTEELTRTKGEMEAFLADEAKLSKIIRHSSKQGNIIPRSHLYFFAK